MRVVQVLPGVLYSPKYPFERAGAEWQIFRISAELVKKGHEVFIMGRFSEMESDRMEVEGVEFVNVKTPHLRDDFMYQLGSSVVFSKAVADIIFAIRPDMLGLHDRYSAIFPSRLSIPKTYTLHNPDALDLYREFAIDYNILNVLFFPLKARIEQSVISRSNATIALTEGMREYLSSRGIRNVSVIANGVQPDEYLDQGDSNYVLFAGRFNKVKGIEYLIAAFSGIARDLDFNLVLVGSGPDERRIRNKVVSLGLQERVRFVPMSNRKELRDYYSRCSLLVLPSLHETFGMVMIEAMASGKTVIASDIPGPNDVIRNGHNGFLFEKGSAEHLERILRLCLSDKQLRRNVGANARRTVEDKYTFERSADSYIRLWEGIACQTSE